MDNEISFGKHPFAQHFMKGIFSLRPALPEQFAVWDPDIVLGYLSNLRSMKTTKPDFCTIFAKRPMKSTKPGFHQFPIVFSEYPSNRKICFVTTITHYSAITKDLRTTDQQIVSYMKPQKEVTTSTISTLCKVMLGKAGIDI